MSELLLYLALVDLREFSDGELRDYLELLLGSLMAACGELPSVQQPLLQDEERDSALELREQLYLQLEAEAPDRRELSAWVEDYPELLPKTVSDLTDRLEDFDAFLQVLFEDEQLEDDQRLVRFRDCLELLDVNGDWQQRSEAARGLATLEEELFVYRNTYTALPKYAPQTNSIAVIAHMNLMEGFDVWQSAFRLVHEGELDQALDTAFEGTCLFYATERWPLAKDVPKKLTAQGSG